MSSRIPLGMGKLPAENISICCTTPSEVFGFPISLAKRRAGLGFRGRRCHYGNNAPLNFAKIQMGGIVPSVDCVLQPVDSRIGEGSDGGGENRMVTESAVVKHGVQRYLLAVEYDGTRFSGSQWQPNCRTVVGVLQDAFQNFIGHPVPVFCSSRTDARVHALSNVCHADVERISKRRPGEVLPPHEPGVVKKAVNHFLQKSEGDIRVIDVRSVPANFHSRFSAQNRTYFYRLLSGPGPLSLFERGRAWHVHDELDVISMQKACDLLVGHHDFSSFRAARCQAKSPIKTLDELCVSEVVPLMQFPSIIKIEKNSIEGQFVGDAAKIGPPGSNGLRNDFGVYTSTSRETFGQIQEHHCFIVTARARSFLYHQVRLLVGVLKSVGVGEITVNDVERILNAKTFTACPMAPACGLYLGHVQYDLP